MFFVFQRIFNFVENDALGTRLRTFAYTKELQRNIITSRYQKENAICSKSKIDTQDDVSDIVLVSFLLTLNIFQTLLIFSAAGRAKFALWIVAFTAFQLRQLHLFAPLVEAAIEPYKNSTGGGGVAITRQILFHFKNFISLRWGVIV